MNFNEEVWPVLSMRFKTLRTKKVYYSTLCDFYNITGILDLYEASEKDVYKYIEEKNRQVLDGTFKESTRNTYLYQLNSIFKNSTTFNNAFKNPFAGIGMKDNSGAINVLELPSFDDVKTLLNAEDVSLRIIFELIILCALTPSEICRIRTKDCLCGVLRVHAAGYERLIALPDSITAYIESMPFGDVFSSSRGNKMTPNLLFRMVKRATPYTMQTLRTYAIIQMYLSGAEDEVIKKYTGIKRHIWRYRYASDMVVADPLDFSHILS